MHIRRNLGILRMPLLYALLANVTEIMAIYVVYLAFGATVNPGAVILAYAIANFAGLVSVLPGGVSLQLITQHRWLDRLKLTLVILQTTESETQQISV